MIIDIDKLTIASPLYYLSNKAFSPFFLNNNYYTSVNSYLYRNFSDIPREISDTIKLPPNRSQDIEEAMKAKFKNKVFSTALIRLSGIEIISSSNKMLSIILNELREYYIRKKFHNKLPEEMMNEDLKKPLHFKTAEAKFLNFIFEFILSPKIFEELYNIINRIPFKNSEDNNNLKNFIFKGLNSECNIRKSTNYEYFYRKVFKFINSTRLKTKFKPVVITNGVILAHFLSLLLIYIKNEKKYVMKEIYDTGLNGEIHTDVEEIVEIEAEITQDINDDLKDLENEVVEEDNFSDGIEEV